ncbi:MAG: trypsin-like peptidase domain-containing protein [Bacteroidota bacterium]
MSTPQRFVIRHQTGSKANQVEEFPFHAFEELTIGRGGSTDVVYDADQDELVSREHAKITRDGEDTYAITDLGSRNGTFLNKVQVAGTATIRPGDRVQLGTDGPEFVFDAEPRPARETVVASGRSHKATTLSPSLAAATDRAPAKPGVGRETVERIVTESARQSQKSSTGMILGISAGVLALVAALFFFMRQDTDARISDAEATAGARADSIEAATEAAANAEGMTPAQIAAEHGDAVVYIEATWKLIDAASDQQIYHRHQVLDLGDGQASPKAVFIRLPNGTVEPFIETADPNGINRPIRSQGTGTGFVISQDGFIMTNKHVVAGWNYPYFFPQGTFPAVVYSVTAQGEIDMQNPSVLQSPQEVGQWVPSQSVFYRQQQSGVTNFDPLKGVPELQVTFQNSDIPFEAELERVSPRGDAATIKIDAQEPLHALDLHDSYETTEVGEPVVVMGYPGISGFDISVVQNTEMGNGGQVGTVVPRPTVTPANISTIHRTRQGSNPNEAVISASGFPDAYQLSTSETGAGNSGGPVFDEQGRVIGIFTYSAQTDARVTFAIPIKYGMDLLRATGTL